MGFVRDFCVFVAKLAVGVLAISIMMVGVIWYMTRPTTYDFGNGALLVVPCGTVSVDQREEGLGVVVQSGVNVTVRNDSDEWRSLTVCYCKPNYGHTFEDLPPKSVKTFGVESTHSIGMHVSVSDYAQEKRDKPAKTTDKEI